MSVDDSPSDPKFTFQHLCGKNFYSIEGKDNQDFLIKWSMKGRIKACTFGFDQAFRPYEKERFVMDFMNDPEVLSHLEILSSSGKWSSVGTAAASVKVESVPSTKLSMTFFDRLYKDIARESGQICKCFDDFYEDIQISDELRKMFLLDDSDNYCLYSDDERDEFLFRLFEHFCLGGSVCQFEDNMQPYLDITKSLYKDLVSVQKHPESKELAIISHTFKIAAMDDSGTVYYPANREHRQTFSYLTVDPLKRNVTVLYHRFGGGVFS